MDATPNAVELTVDNAWFIAETIGAGTFPWVLAITMPYSDAAQRGAFVDRQRDELTRMGLLSPQGVINPAVADWIKVVCFPDRWLDLRYVGPASADGACELLRGIVALRTGTGKTSNKTGNGVVALRNAQLVTFTATDIDDPGRWFRFLVSVWRTGRRRGSTSSACRRGWARGPTNGCGPACHSGKSLTIWVFRRPHGRWWSPSSRGRAATSRSSPGATVTAGTPPPRSA